MALGILWATISGVGGSNHTHTSLWGATRVYRVYQVEVYVSRLIRQLITNPKLD
ncbi:MAG: hypothetical protein QW453_03610 [Thermoprotei archaeon]